MIDSFLEQKTEDELWITYKKTRDQNLRNMFIRQYIPLVKYVAGKVSIGMPENVEFDDLVSFGQFGLMDAVEKFDPRKKVKFKTYAVARIKGAIFDELRLLDWIPRSVRQKTRELEDTVGRLESKLGRAATDAEIAAAMNVSADGFHKITLKVFGTAVFSLSDMRVSSDDSERISIEDSIESPASLNPDTIVEREELRQLIARAISELPEKERIVLVLYYHEDLTFKEIGRVLNVSESRISQIHTRANIRLRARLGSLRKSAL
ncbi:RNA polymerase sigma factor WhiG [Treponema endosymbiont of Eucomonympha sp.]|uniref:RNA polymerase sigma factor WhiG n=1 Tax=Treponema endosymbiont of Eucomonympha sp. TaxID=1580831 RepID=UPI000785795A|nr:RNA polymerase sigma factor WhiG [Treponema endosymbiont of Eucomonympha sp.]